MYNGSAPAYLAQNIRLTADVEIRRHLRSSTTTTLVVPPVQRSTMGDRAFPVAAPRAWNSLPPSLRTVSSLVPFRHLLKTFLFVHSFDWHLLISPSLLFCKVPLQRFRDSITLIFFCNNNTRGQHHHFLRGVVDHKLIGLIRTWQYIRQ